MGAGPGFLASYARQRRPDLRWIASDLLVAPWNDVAADAQQLPFGDGSFDALLGVDVLHHLTHINSFFTESARILKPGGRISLAEPWVTPLSYPVYRWLHQEGCTLSIDPWHPFAESAKDPWEGDAAVPWRLVRDTGEARWRELGLGPPRVAPMNAFAYLFTLGFRNASLLPRRLTPALLWLDRRSRALASLLGLRVLLSWIR